MAQKNNLHNCCIFINACACARCQALFKAHLKHPYPQMSDSYVELTSCCKSCPPCPSEGALWLHEHSGSRGAVPAWAVPGGREQQRTRGSSAPQRGRAERGAAAELPAARLKAEYGYVCTRLPHFCLLTFLSPSARAGITITHFQGRHFLSPAGWSFQESFVVWIQSQQNSSLFPLPPSCCLPDPALKPGSPKIVTPFP